VAGLASELLGGVPFGMAEAGAVATLSILVLPLLHQAQCWSAANHATGH
jgi:hypothetical protein